MMPEKKAHYVGTLNHDYWFLCWVIILCGGEKYSDMYMFYSAYIMKFTKNDVSFGKKSPEAVPQYAAIHMVNTTLEL